MARKTFTITVDGVQLGKRTSDTRTYTHALVASPEDRDAALRREVATVSELSRQLGELNAALIDPKVTIRNRGFGSNDLDHRGRPYYHQFEIFLKGAGSRVYSHSNSKGEVSGGWPIREDGTWDMAAKWDGDLVTPAKAYLVASAQERVRNIMGRIKDHQDRIHALENGDLTILGGAYVVSWHTSHQLAVKAQGSAAKHDTARRITVAPVDAN